MTNKEAIEQLKELRMWMAREFGVEPNELDRESIHMAIEALEKQEPQKVEWTVDRTWGTEKEAPVCPSCGYYLTPIQFIDMNICEQTGHCEFLKVSYCEHCSQAIDWSEEE